MVQLSKAPPAEETKKKPVSDEKEIKKQPVSDQKETKKQTVSDEKETKKQPVSDEKETKKQPVSDEKETSSHQGYNSFKGLLFAFSSGAIYSLCAVIVKDLQNIHPEQLVVYRFYAMFSVSLPNAVRSQEPLFGSRCQRPLLLLRGLIGGIHVLLQFVAFRFLPLGEATVLIFSFPVLATIAGRIFLTEPCGALEAIPVLTTFVGMILITGFYRCMFGMAHLYTTERIYGIAAALTSLVTGTAQVIVLRKLRDVHHSVLTFTGGWVGLIVTLLIGAVTGSFSLRANCGQHPFILLLGLLSYLGMTALTVALHYEEAGPVSTMRASADIVLSLVWQTTIFGNAPDGISIIGAALVGSSVVLIGFRKSIKSKFSKKCQRSYKA